jgi:hypothetical protein
MAAASRGVETDVAVVKYLLVGGDVFMMASDSQPAVLAEGSEHSPREMPRDRFDYRDLLNANVTVSDRAPSEVLHNF